MQDSTLPGTTPGLLRKGSPVISPKGYVGNEPPGAKGVVLGIQEDGAFICAFRWTDTDGDVESEEIHTFSASELELDLEDLTGRVHAAWWARGQTPLDAGEAVIVDCAQAGYSKLALNGNLTPALRDVCRRLLGWQP